MNDSAHGNDIQQIEALIATYIEGGRSGNNDALRPIFHELATICGYVGPDLFAGPIEMFYDWHAENGPAADLQVGRVDIDCEGTAASVRVELDNWTGHHFSDFFTLVKIDGNWQIMSKVFYLHPETTMAP
ncbi:MAG: nuclear transport factor 2 family protein [Wenzhouxiangella sp.]